MKSPDATSQLHRRAFLAQSATTAASLLFAHKLFGAPDANSTKPNPALEKLAGDRPRRSQKARRNILPISASTATATSSTGYRLSPERGSTKTDEVPFVNDGSSFGFGVRVIAKGQWGFAASPLVTAEEIARITREAVAVAKANSVAAGPAGATRPHQELRRPLESPFEKDPFAVPVDEKLELHPHAPRAR